MTQPQQEPQVQLPPLPVSAISVILEGLAQVPLGRSADVFFLVKSEAEKQLAPKPEPAADKKE